MVYYPPQSKRIKDQTIANHSLLSQFSEVQIHQVRDQASVGILVCHWYLCWLRISALQCPNLTELDQDGCLTYEKTLWQDQLQAQNRRLGKAGTDNTFAASVEMFLE